MTTPKVNTIKRGDSRFYVSPITGAKAPGVTSVLNMLPKPFLKFWASKSVAEAAVDNLGDIVGITLRGGRDAAVDMLKRAPDRDTKAAADIGTEAHNLFERMAKGETIRRVHPDLQPFVSHFEEFLAEFSPEFIFMEETVWSEAYDYAGSFDAFAIINGERIWLDYKTTRSGAHAETAIQLAAYRHADYIVRPDGSKVPMPGADGGAVLHVRPEGWALIPAKCDAEVFAFFRHLREVFRWEREVKDTVLGDPLNTPANAPRRRTPTPRRAS